MITGACSNEKSSMATKNICATFADPQIDEINMISLYSGETIRELDRAVKKAIEVSSKLDHSTRTMFGIPSTLAKMTKLMAGSVPVLIT